MQLDNSCPHRNYSRSRTATPGCHCKLIEIFAATAPNKADSESYDVAPCRYEIDLAPSSGCCIPMQCNTTQTLYPHRNGDIAQTGCFRTLRSLNATSRVIRSERELLHVVITSTARSRTQGAFFRGVLWSRIAANGQASVGARTPLVTFRPAAKLKLRQYPG